MIQSWFECKVRYEKMQENGSAKRVTEPYLVAAENFTDAEERITEEMLPFVSQGEFLIPNIKPAKYAELFLTAEESCDRYYKAKVRFITLDEKTGNEKATNSLMLVQAADLEDATSRLKEGMKNTLADYAIVGINETPIMDVYETEYTKQQQDTDTDK